MSNYFQAIVFLVLSQSFLIVPVSAQDQEKVTHCVALFRRMNHEIKTGYVQLDTRMRIAEVFSDETLSPQQRAKNAFDVVVSDRIGLLTKGDAEQVKKFLNERVMRNYQVNGRYVDGGFFDSPLVNKKIKIHLPQNFSESIIEYAMLTHELEHYIQTRVASKGFAGGMRLFVDSLNHFVDHKYEREMGAMIAEFNFMKALPLEIRKNAQKEVMLYRFNLSKGSLDLLLSMLDVEQFDVSSYIQKQHESGRYNRNSFIAFEQSMQLKYGDLKTQMVLLIGGYGSIPTMMGLSKIWSEIKQWCGGQLSEEKERRGLSVEALLEVCKRFQR